MNGTWFERPAELRRASACTRCNRARVARAAPAGYTSRDVTAREILEAALKLAPEERWQLIQDLGASLPDDFVSSEVEQAWLAEIDRRSSEIDAGTAELVDWSEVRERIAQRRARRAG
jgi:putative addiction module component (TIGR02574 family)